jgi:hypothetical protein
VEVRKSAPFKMLSEQGNSRFEGVLRGLVAGYLAGADEQE